MKPIVVAMLTAGLVGGFSVSASATVVEKKSVKKFCKKLLTVGSEIDPSSDIDDASEGAEQLADDYRKVAKAAPTKKIKKAVKGLAEYYDEISDDPTSPDIDEDLAEDYAQALSTVSQYIATKCISTEIPDITLPNGDDFEIPGA